MFLINESGLNLKDKTTTHHWLSYFQITSNY